MKSICICDIESDGLLDSITQIHCAWCYEIETDEWLGFRPDVTYVKKREDGWALPISKLAEHLNTYDVVVFHNGYGFDIPAIKKVLGTEITSELFDTLVAARLRHPDIIGGHSLKAWGKRLGVLKGQITEDEETEDVWSEFTEDMYEYCKQDVAVTLALYERLAKHYDVYNLEDEHPYQCELAVAQITDKSERHGVNFDHTRARFLVHTLTEEIVKVDNEAIPQLPLMVHHADAYAKPFLKSGKLAKWPSLYCEMHGIDPDHIAGPFSRVWFTPFDMTKTDKVKRVLIDHGWIPTEWNIKKLEEEVDKVAWVEKYIEKNFIKETSQAWKDILLKALHFKGLRNRVALRNFLLDKRYIETSPKITEDSLESVEGNVGHLVKRRVMLAHRRSLVTGLLDSLRPDGKLGAGCNPCATPTFRANYRTVVNIPAARSEYGKECRSLFVPDNGYHLIVGSDAKGLEARMLCHYMDDPMYTDILLNGDIHTYNQELAGLPTRDDAKTFLYALLYGAGDANLGAQVGGTKKDGAQLRARFMAGLPKYAELVNRLTKEARDGKIEGLDGRPIKMRRGADGEVQTHKALNTLLQSAGAIVMKYGMIFLDKWVTEAKLEAYQVLWMHDEVQWSVHKKGIDQFVAFANNYVRHAGEHLNMNLPLASEAMVGRSWYATH